MVVIGGIMLAQALPGWLPEKPGSELLEDWVEKNTGAKLTAGWVAPLFYPGVGIQIRDLELKLKEGEGEERDFFSAKSIKVVADAGDLLRHRRITWKEIIIEEPSLSLVRVKKGEWNVKNWIRELPRPRPKDPEEEGLLLWMVKDSLKQALPTTSTQLSDLFSMDRIEVRDAQIHIIDKGKGRKGKMFIAPVDLEKINLRFERAPGENKASVKIFLPFPRNGPELKLSAALEAVSDTEIAISSLSGGWSGISIHDISGNIKIKPQLHFNSRINATISYPSLKRFLMWPPIARSRTMPFTSGSGSVRIKARVWGPAPERAAKIHYQGTITLNNVTWDPGRVIAPIENANVVIALNDGVVELPPTTIEVAGFLINGSARIIESKTPRFIIHSEVDKIDLGKFFQPRRRGMFNPTMSTAWEGEGIIGEGVYGKMRFQDVKGYWVVSNKRRLTFSELYFKSCGGTYTESGRSWVDFNHKTDVNFRFDGRIRGMDVTAFADQVFDATTFLHGTFDADGYTTGKFVSGDFMSRTFGGDLKVTVRDGYFEDMNLMGGVLDFLGLPLPADLKGQKFDKMTATVRLDKGVAYFSDLVVHAPGLRADVKGWIDFHTEHADLKIVFHPKGVFVDLVKNLPLIGRAGEALTTLYVRATGHWDFLEYSLWNPSETDSPPPPKEILEDKKEDGEK